ncbi:PAS domain-containing protein [Archangium violaceum]|uniref:ATP-binding protein n=1 Tax=Archangium violaceum TaxID=83451 RepID=UPI00194E744A|nr:ATP-binding protein [Archangium violaceum]QRN98196.1 PAS domain-containing protein [Archangium violaceum]
MEMDVRSVLDSLGDPLLVVDRSALILHSNAGVRELLGWSRLELLGRPLSTVIPSGLPGLPREGPSVPPWGRRATPPPPRQPLRVRALRHDGGVREVAARLSPWPGGEAEGLLVVSIHELDAQVELERQLELCRRLNVLDAALTQVLALASDEEEAAHALLRACGETEEWVVGTYWQLEPEEQVLVPLTFWTSSCELGDFASVTLRRTFTPPEGLPGRVWSLREPVCVRDVTQEAGFFRADVAARRNLRGGLFIPVVGGGRVYGVLELFSREPRQNPREDEVIATTIGQRFGQFLDRLRLSEAELVRGSAPRRIWDSDLLGLFVSNNHGRLLDANATLLRMLGYSRRDLGEERLTWATLTPPRQRITLEGALRRLRSEGVFHSMEGELLRKDGDGVRVLLGSASLDEGRVATFVVDLSDWKPAESGPLREVESRLQSLISHAPVVLFALDRDGVFTLSEGQGLGVLGLKPGQVVGMSVFEVYRSEPAVLTHVRRALAGDDFFSVELLSTGLVYETHWTPLRDSDGRLAGTLGLAVDVTQREREARWRAQLLAEAEEARSVAERAVKVRDDFLSVASHELKTPLTSLNLQLHALLKRARQGQRPEDTEQVGRLEKAQRHLQKLARMMDDLLDVSRVAEGQLRLELGEVDLVRLVREVLERFQEEAQRTGTHLELKGEDAVVGRWDRTRLEQVVTNLVSNALKYGAGAPVELHVRSSGSLALLEVTDHGIGISPADLARIFEKFERAVPVRKYGGFGLGLYIVRQLVEALGGAVDAESTPGKGTTFHIALPLAGPGTHALPHAPAETGLH